MRRINHKLFKSWVRKNGEFALVKLSYESRVGVSLLRQLWLGKYRANLKTITREKIADAVGVSEDELFPPDPEDEATAS